MNFSAHLIEMALRTQEAERRAAFITARGSLPERPRFAWLRRRTTKNQPLVLSRSQPEPEAP